MFFTAAIQGIGVLCAAGVAGLLGGATAGLAALYGGGAALANTGLLLWRLKRGERDYHCDGPRHLRSFYRSMLERFFVVGAWMAVGLGLLKLPPLPLLAGFLVGLLAWMIALAARKRI